MKATQRQWALLAFLILVWGALLLARWSRSAPPVSPTQATAPTRVEARAVKTTAAPPRLRIELLRARGASLPETPKNLFAAVVEPPAPPPPPPKLGGAAPAPIAAPPPDPFLEGLKGLKFLGFARERGRVLGFLSRGGEFLTVEEKELFLNQYVVARITEDSIILATPDGAREARLTLSP